MVTISAGGATQAVDLRMNSGLGLIQYSTDAQATWIDISGVDFPVTIINTDAGTSNVLNVNIINPLTISSTYGNVSGYLNTGSTYISYDGSGNTITFNGITNYPGFIRNGTSASTGRSNITVQNFVTDISNSSTLTSTGGAGWLCQEYFGNGSLANLITGCTNNGAINGENSGGIAGNSAGSGILGGVVSVTFTNCTNTGNMITTRCAGIAGSGAGGFSGSVTFTNCTNSGVMSNTSCSGIAGVGAGYFSGLATFTNCTNTANMTNASCGGIVSKDGGTGNGGITFTNCTNSGNMTGANCGGIIGTNAGRNGSATFIGCVNVGDISNNDCGGIVGDNCCFDAILCNITNCYSTGVIRGNKSGGITGPNLGANTGATTPAVNITNCYSLGTIASSCGGIIGGLSGGSYTNTPTITISNCYSYGAITPTGQGIVGPGYSFIPAQNNCYAANGVWSVATANANLTGTPTSLTSNNPGATWTMITTSTPYVLSLYNASLYSPSSAGTGAKTYTTSPGLFQSGYNYQIIYSNQVSNVLTTYVLVSKGTGPYYNSYNVNTFTLTAINVAPGSISAGIIAATGVLNFVLPDAPCFLEGTKILCFKNNQEIYRPIESLRKGDLVKTIYNGYMPVNMICTSVLYNPGNDHRITNRLYKCSKERYPELFEDLYITGCHSILLPWLTDQQWELTKSVNGNVFVTDNHFRLIAYADELAEPFNKEGYMNIYHVALDHHDEYMNYGIYANGLLVESCSIDCLIYSGMKELGENDSSVAKDMSVNNAGNMSQMVGAC